VVKIMSPFIYLKSVSKWSTAVSLKHQPKSVSDTGNPYHVASLFSYKATHCYIVCLYVFTYVPFSNQLKLMLLLRQTCSAVLVGVSRKAFARVSIYRNSTCSTILTWIALTLVYICKENNRFVIKRLVYMIQDT